MPRLRPWLTTSEHPRYDLAIDLLGTVGDGRSEAVPFLVRSLGSTNRFHRMFAAQSLNYFGAEARTAVPALIEALGDPAAHIRAIRALGNIGPEAKDALPALERLLDSRDPREALVAAAALHKIRPEGNGLRLLIEAAGDPRSRMAAVSELGELGPAAMPAVDVLLEALKSDAGRDRAGGLQAITIADALRKVSPTNREAILILLEKLKGAQGPYPQNNAAGSIAMNAYGYAAAGANNDRLNIASRLIWFDPSESHGLAVLVETLNSDPDPGRRTFAAYVLRQAGPGARAAIPALKAALNDKDKAVRTSAASALRKIAVGHISRLQNLMMQR